MIGGSMTGIKVLTAVGMLSGGGVVLAQSVPIPSDINKWSATAIMGSICLICLSLVYFMMKNVFSSLERIAENHGKSTSEQSQTNKNLNELNGKLGDLALELRGRPCMSKEA